LAFETPVNPAGITAGLEAKRFHTHAPAAHLNRIPVSRFNVVFQLHCSGLKFAGVPTAMPIRVNLSFGDTATPCHFLFCVLVYRFCRVLEWLGDTRRQISPLRLARIIGQCACRFAVTVPGLTHAQWLKHRLTCHLFYEQRRDRKKFIQPQAVRFVCPKWERSSS
jgi:hypothetical protein